MRAHCKFHRCIYIVISASCDISCMCVYVYNIVLIIYTLIQHLYRHRTSDVYFKPLHIYTYRECYNTRGPMSISTSILGRHFVFVVGMVALGFAKVHFCF